MALRGVIAHVELNTESPAVRQDVAMTAGKPVASTMTRIEFVG